MTEEYEPVYIKCYICEGKEDVEDVKNLGNEYPEGEHLCYRCEEWIKTWLQVCPLCRCEYLGAINDDGDGYADCKCYEWQHKRDTSGLEPKTLEYLKECRVNRYSPYFKEQIPY